MTIDYMAAKSLEIARPNGLSPTVRPSLMVRLCLGANVKSAKQRSHPPYRRVNVLLIQENLLVTTGSPQHPSQQAGWLVGPATPPAGVAPLEAECVTFAH
jgi:hypothetical protein